MNIFNIFVLLIIVICLASTNKTEAAICIGDNTSLSCLYNNFDSLYENDYARFWNIINSKELEARKCIRVDHAVEFLNLVTIKTNNIEFIEYLSQAIEKLLLSNHMCFFNAALKLEPETRTLLIEKLKHPLFHDQKEIDKIFDNAKNNKKYKRLSNQYFNRKN